MLIFGSINKFNDTAYIIHHPHDLTAANSIEGKKRKKTIDDEKALVYRLQKFLNPLINYCIPCINTGLAYIANKWSWSNE